MTAIMGQGSPIFNGTLPGTASAYTISGVPFKPKRVIIVGNPYITGGNVGFVDTDQSTGTIYYATTSTGMTFTFNDDGFYISSTSGYILKGNYVCIGY